MTKELLDGQTRNEYVYDNRGNVERRTDHVANLTTAFDYDQSDRVVRTSVYTGDSTKAADLESRMQYTYTQSGKVGTLSYQEKGGDIRTYSYTYDKDEKPTKAVYPDKSYTTWTYDSLRRNTKAVYAPTKAAKDAKKLYTLKTYKASNLDNSGETKNATTAFVSTYTNQFGSSGAAVSAYSYTYDNWGNIRTITGLNEGIRTYEYNDYGEVTKAQETYADGTTRVYEYTYDAGGNITEEKVSEGVLKHENLARINSAKPIDFANVVDQSYFDVKESYTNTYGYANVWKDQLTSYRIGDTTYNISYDGAGNPISYMGASLTWNETGNLTSIQTGTNPYMASGANQTIAYTYLSDGTRRTKTVNGKTTTYHYNNGLLLSETTVSAGTANGNGSTGSNANNAEAETLSYYYGSTGKLASVTYQKGANTPVSYFYAYNGQGDVIALYRSSDSVLIGTYEYDLWGRPVSVKEATAGIDVNGILTKNPFRYRGYYYDEETGFYYLNARYYDSQVRRFISADDMAYLGADGTVNTYNLFAYCENDPVQGYDPTGCRNEKGVSVGKTISRMGIVSNVLFSGSIGGAVMQLVGGMTTYAAETDGVLVLDLSATISTSQVGIYGKLGGSLVIDFATNDVNLYGHVGGGGGINQGGISGSTGIVSNYKKPKDYAGVFIDANMEGLFLMIDGCFGPFENEQGTRTCATSIGLSFPSPKLGGGIGADYYSEPIKLY